MINTSQVFNSKIVESTRQFSARLIYGTKEISGAIRSVQITSGACGEGDFTVGAVFSSYIEVVIDKCEEVLENKELLLQIGLYVDDDTVEYADIGYYTVMKPKSSAYSTTFTAVGRITSKLNELFDVPAVLTLRNIANAITAATGVAITFNGEVSDAVLASNMTGMTCREALSVIAGTFGGFATEDNTGNIVVNKYSTGNKIPVDADRMTVLPEFNDLNYDLYGIKVVVSAAGEDEDGNAIEEVAFTEGTPRLTMTNEFMTADLFESFVANTVGYTYRPGTVPLALGDPRLQPWDCLEVTDVKGTVHVIPCLNIVHTFDGGLSTTITAPGESESESSASVAGPITQQLDRMNSLLLTAQEAIIKRLKADDLEAEVAKLGYATVKSLEAVNAIIGDLKAKDAEITGKLTASDVAIENLKAKDTEITGQLTAANAEITNLKAKDVEIEGTLTTAAADIKSLKAKDVEIDGTLKSATADITNLKAKDVEIEGTLKAANAEIDSLKAKAITTENLSANVATLGYATIDQLETANGRIDDLTAKAITTDNLYAKVATFGYAKATDLEAVNLKVTNLTGDVASFKETTTENFTATNANITKVSGDLAEYKEFVADEMSANNAAFVNMITQILEAAEAEFKNLYAEDARIESMFADYATVKSLNATNANIEALEADQAAFETATAENFSAVNASIEEIAADYITTAQLDAESAEIQKLFAGYATVGSLNATNANVTNLSTKQANFETATANNFTAVNASINNIKADYVKTTALEAESADIRALFAGYATVGQLNATNGNIETLNTTVGTIEKAYMNEAKVDALVVGKGYLTEAQVNTLVAGKGYFTEAQVNNLVAGKGYITTAETNTLLSNYVKTTTLTADYIKAADIASTYATISNLNAANARIDGLNATYATIDLANVKAGSITQAMIGTGVVGTAQIADGSITDAKIVGLTANKITAGRLDAGVIEVVNLNAANITVGTINGQQIASGAIDTSKLTSSLSSTISTASTNASKALTDAANAQTTANKSYEKVNSKGEQLIVNGNGMMGNNTNFSSWTFDGATGNNSPGSFTRAAGATGTLYSDEYFLVSTNNTYTFSFDAKSLLGKGTMYSFLMFYDVDKNTITSPNHMYHPGSTTTLAKDLKAGDTVIYLTDASGWSTSVSYGFYLSIWNYKNSKGYTYPPESYTRNRITLPKTSSNTLDSSKINYTANTITLASAYSGSTIPAGTSVSQGRDGATYKYMPIGGTVIPTAWTRYSGKMIGVDYSGTNVGNKFPPGVAYARIGFLWNYNKASGEQQWITNITVTDTTAVDKAQTTADGKNTVFYQTSAPSTSDRKTNDIWFDTDDGNKMYYWNGSAWTVRQFGTNAIANAAITNALIADATIQNAKIANLDAAKITTGTLSADRIAASSIVAAKIASGAITADKLGASSVTAGKIAADAVTTGTIAAGAVTADKIVSEAITTDKIAANAITANKIQTGAITTDKIAANAVTASKVSVDTLSALSANLGTVTAGILQSENFVMSDYRVNEDGTITGSVEEGLKIDLNNKAYYTPHITIKDNYININGHMTIGDRSKGSIGAYSFAQGIFNIASGWLAHAEGCQTEASEQCAHAEGRLTVASGYRAHAEGIGTTASGQDSHAEGTHTVASGDASHAEGSQAVASGDVSHAEGQETIASGYMSHAEGDNTVASKWASHAEGYYTIAASSYQHVQGKCNIEDDVGTYAHIVGNGSTTLIGNTSDVEVTRSNAHTLKWNGTAWYASDVIVGGTQSANGSVTGGVSLKNHTHSWDTITGKPSTFTPASHTHNYLPLSGGTLDTGATITLDTYGTRKLVLSGNSISADMSKETGGWAGNFASVKDPSGTTTTMLGWYGGATGLTHIFMGGTYSDPALKMTGAGQFTFKNTPYVGSTLVSLANHTHNYAGSSSAGGAATTALACTGNSATATKATQDGDGNVITSTYLPKTTYEYNKELALGGSGAICIGKFKMYDSNITVEISSTTSTTYNGTLVIATQNYGKGGAGSFTASVYGDVSNTIAPNIYIYNVGSSGVVEVYFKPATYSKNLMHVQCQALTATPTDILTSITAVPSTATTKPTNLLKSALDGKADSEHTHNYAGSSSAGGAATTALACTGNSATATKLATARTISLTGSVTGTGTFDGSGNLSITTTTNHSHTLDYRLQAAQSTATGSDANSATTTGFHYINGTTNRPSFNQNNGVTGNDYRILTTAYSATWLQQIATDFRCDDIFYRRNQSGTWQSWRKLAFADEHLSSSGGTVSGNLVLHAASGDSPKLIFQRGDNTGSVTDWNMYVSNGVLKVNTVSSSGSTAETTIAEFNYSGSLNIKGSIQENGTALSSKYAPLSHTHDYAPSSHSHDYVSAFSQSAYNVNSCYDAGLYMVASGSNLPSSSPYGSLLTLPYRKRTGNTTPDFGTQIFIPNGDDGTKANSMFYRTSLSGSWNAWQEVATKADITSHTHNYLPLSGGTLTGDITLPNATPIHAKNSSGNAHPLIYLSTANNLTLGNPADGNPVSGGLRIYTPNGSMHFTSNGGTLQWYAYSNSSTGTSAIFNTSQDSIAMLGSSSYRWYRLYQAASSVSTSDEREKSNIKAIADYPIISTKNGKGNVLEQIFNELVPKTYTLNVEKTDDVHIGFIAQDVERTINKYGLTADNLGLINHEYWTDEETGEKRDRYGLAYEEFTALNTYMIQKQHEVDIAHEGRIARAEAQIENLQEQLSYAMIKIAQQQKEIDSLRQVS